jgi:hypothetical protein
MWSDNIGNMFVIFLHSGWIIPNIRVNIDIIIINYSTTTSFNKHEISYTYILTVYNILDHFLIIHYERE